MVFGVCALVVSGCARDAVGSRKYLADALVGKWEHTDEKNPGMLVFGADSSFDAATYGRTLRQEADRIALYSKITYDIRVDRLPMELDIIAADVL